MISKENFSELHLSSCTHPPKPNAHALGTRLCVYALENCFFYCSPIPGSHLEQVLDHPKNLTPMNNTTINQCITVHRAVLFLNPKIELKESKQMFKYAQIDYKKYSNKPYAFSVSFIQSVE